MRMSIVREGAAVRDRVADWRRRGSSVALVPTMGNLHAGHLSLAGLARRHADRVLMTVFVNRAQFGVGEDFSAYPRTLDDDIAQAESSQVVDAMFVPDETVVYPFGADDAVRVVMPPLARDLCGAARPGHFDGVGSVICRLLNVTTPDLLVLGQKDFQQLVLIRRLIADLLYPVSVLSAPIVREIDGLAMSSRNRYLDAEERARAPALNATIMQIAQRLRSGAADHAALCADGRAALDRAGLRPDYVAIRRAEDLAHPTADDPESSLIVLAAVRLGRARLIDNVCVADVDAVAPV